MITCVYVFVYICVYACAYVFVHMCMYCVHSCMCVRERALRTLGV